VVPPGQTMASAPELTLELPATNMFVGQPGTVRILLQSFSAGLPQILTQIQLIGQGFITDQGAVRQKMEGATRGSSNIITFVHETVLTPVAAGALEIFAQGFTTSPRLSAWITNKSSITIGPPQYVLMESEPARLLVRPLPKEGELRGFTG